MLLPRRYGAASSPCRIRRAHPTGARVVFWPGHRSDMSAGQAATRTSSRTPLPMVRDRAVVDERAHPRRSRSSGTARWCCALFQIRSSSPMILADRLGLLDADAALEVIGHAADCVSTPSSSREPVAATNRQYGGRRAQARPPHRLDARLGQTDSGGRLGFGK